jgi:GT2 family glycosyltransferase
MPGDQPLATVVVPTRDRHESLRRTLDALRRQETDRAWELVVVDDGSEPPVAEALLEGLPAARIVRSGGMGPARARNAGVAAAQGEHVLFTDDDTEPAPAWVESALAFLEDAPEHVGVQGPVASPPFDPLFAVSLEADVPGHYWTCNIAFRRSVLEDLGGFYDGFPFAHCEDLDLAYRALARGPIGWAPGMRIVHHPRSQSLGQLAGRGRMTVSEMTLFARHPERFGRLRRLPARLFPLFSSAGFLRVMAREANRAPAARLPRALLLAVGYEFHVLAGMLRTRPPRRDPQLPPR